MLDELGYVPASKAGAELLFDVIAAAYERNRIIETKGESYRLMDAKRRSEKSRTDKKKSA